MSDNWGARQSRLPPRHYEEPQGDETIPQIKISNLECLKIKSFKIV
ncbi:MAG TPA: hypothetical protein VJB67_00135 [Patescibacteria group bacterium]|nr:hypothetical protein [Patescibacteria group bacterium]